MVPLAPTAFLSRRDALWACPVFGHSLIPPFAVKSLT